MGRLLQRGLLELFWPSRGSFFRVCESYPVKISRTAKELRLLHAMS